MVNGCKHMSITDGNANSVGNNTNINFEINYIGIIYTFFQHSIVLKA